MKNHDSYTGDQLIELGWRVRNRYLEWEHKSDQERQTRPLDLPAIFKKLEAYELPYLLQQASTNEIPDRAPLVVSPPSSPAVSDCSIATVQNTIERERAKLCSAYGMFERTGGRWSQGINDNPGPCPTLTQENITREGECFHCYEHWRKQNDEIAPKLKAWQAFLDFQEIWRAPERFKQYKESTHRHMQEQGFTWKLEMEPELQTELDKWREFYVHVRGRKVGYSRKRQAEAQDQLDRLATLPPEEVAKEARNWYFADGSFSHRLQASDHWLREENFWDGLARNHGQLLPWIERELSKIQGELTPASPQRSAQMRRRLVRSNSVRTRQSERLRNLPPASSLPKLPVRPTRVFKSRRRKRLR